MGVRCSGPPECQFRRVPKALSGGRGAGRFEPAGRPGRPGRPAGRPAAWPPGRSASVGSVGSVDIPLGGRAPGTMLFLGSPRPSRGAPPAIPSLFRILNFLTGCEPQNRALPSRLRREKGNSKILKNTQTRALPSRLKHEKAYSKILKNTQTRAAVMGTGPSK